MFDAQLLSHGSAQARKAAVANVINARLHAGTFSYTELMSQQDPLLSDGMEVLDGVVVENTIPKYQMAPAESWGGQGIVLVHVHPQGHIMGDIMGRDRVPGTNQYQQVKRRKDFGNAAVVSDIPGERIARAMLFRSGWPIVQARTKGASMGSVVEWRWLEREVTLPDVADEVAKLYAEIITRKEFLALSVYAPADQSKIKTPGERRAGASP
jgi:hypothetical protein